MTDSIQRFVFNNIPARGEIIFLQETYREVLQRRAYPAAVQKLLGQTLAAAGLLSAMLKNQGSLILQMQGNGPVSLLLAQANRSQQLRGLANWEGNIKEDNFPQAVGQGHLVITIDPGLGRERYQGVVSLRGENLAQVVENYFLQSEQLPTFLLLAANETVAAGFLLQILPEAAFAEQNVHQGWEHLWHLARSLTVKELLELDANTILHRLFHQESLQHFLPQPVSFVCRCSREAMANAIRTLGHHDAANLAAQKQYIAVTCEFCGKELRFDRIDVERIFAAKSAHDFDDMVTRH